MWSFDNDKNIYRPIHGYFNFNGEMGSLRGLPVTSNISTDDATDNFKYFIQSFYNEWNWEIKANSIFTMCLSYYFWSKYDAQNVKSPPYENTSSMSST